VVILRKTPTGILVVRRVGGPHTNEATSKFKFDKYLKEYLPHKKSSGFSSTITKLRDVPTEFLPEEEK